jgi:hypothetical protein
MKFKKWLEIANEMAKERPELLEAEVVAASDDEGNSFNTVHFTPTPGCKLTNGGGFVTETYFESEADEYREELKVNAICLN